ncbi:MAG: DUF4388 domain-containing protein [Deltaproteobacteria bacterium]|nr:DUF4388 domain-containing protein [Deltaproteobacteria bacterium]
MFPLVHGELAERGPIDLLKLCEEKRFTGLIEIAAGKLGGSLQLRGGEIETIALEGAAADPLDAFLALTAGRYTLRQQMPNLDGGLSNDPIVRGFIADHGPADVLRFCEAAGLSGEVRLSSGKRRVEVLYESGQMTTIKVDGKTDADLEEAWAWTSGEFEVTARPLFEATREEPVADETGQFLRVVQVALAKVIDRAQKVRELTDTQQRPIPLVTRKKPPPPPRADQTVQVYFLEDIVPETSLAEPAASTTRHARKDVTAELVGEPRPAPATVELADTAPSMEAAATSGVGMADTAPWAQAVHAKSPSMATSQDTPPGRASQTPVWVWIALGASIGGVVVALLAQLIR